MYISIMTKIKVGRSNYALIDHEDLGKVSKFSWWISSDGYAYRRIDNKTIRMHRVIMNATDTQMIDHINRNKLDNRKANLRVCTQSQNMLNTNPRSTNKTGVVGVSWDKNRRRWRSSIVVNGKQHNRYFRDFSLAVENRKNYENEFCS